MLTGCAHAAEIADPSKIRDDPEEWEIIESAWQDRADQLFISYTEGWTPQAIDGYRYALADRTNLPGTTDQLGFQEVEPPEQFAEHADDKQ